jgi:hypothetical protein
VIYIDKDNDKPEKAELYISHEYIDFEGNIRENTTLYNLEYKNGSYHIGALYELEITEFIEDDDYYFAFHDGYDMVIPLDDTPYIDPS